MARRPHPPPQLARNDLALACILSAGLQFAGAVSLLQGFSCTGDGYENRNHACGHGFSLTGWTGHGSRHVAYQGQKLAKHAKVTIDDAKQIALKARPGMVTDQELEKEKGGGGLRYSFDIKSDGKTYEVGVDAKSGAILENAPEGKNPD